MLYLIRVVKNYKVNKFERIPFYFRPISKLKDNHLIKIDYLDNYLTFILIGFTMQLLVFGYILINLE